MHADVSTRLARRFGATPRRPEVAELPLRSLALPLDAALATEAGMPTPEVAVSLVATLEQELWA